jgi:hypothetical protein
LDISIFCYGVSLNKSTGLWTELLADDGLDGSGTARVDVEEAGLTTGDEERGEVVKMALLAPTDGEMENGGAGSAN